MVLNGGIRLKFTSWLGWLSVGLIGYKTLVQNRMLVTEKYRVEDRRLPMGFEGCRIVLIADLHKKTFGYGYCNLINSVAAAQPEIIITAGDMYSRSSKNIMPVVKLMKKLSAIAPVYYTPGNHEIGDMARLEKFCRALEKQGITVLRDRSITIERGGSQATLSGLELPLEYFFSYQGGHAQMRKLTAHQITHHIGEPGAGDYTMLISHDPLFLEAYSQWGANLVFSGHIHGGVIRLPVIGGVLSPERKFFPKYSKGLYRMGITTMALTSGLGKFRLNNPSQIMLLILSRTSNPTKRPKNKKWFF